MPVPRLRAEGRRVPIAAALAAFLGITWPLWLNAYLSPPDSASYFAVARSLTHGGDLDFLDDYEALSFERYLIYVTPAGRLSNDWPAGTGLAWVPAHLAARAAGALARAFGCADSRFAPTGVAAVATLATSAWMAFVGAIGLYLAARAVVRAAGGGRIAALGAVALVLLGTPVGFYYYAYAMMSHVVSMTAVAVLLTGWMETRGRPRTLAEWALLGVAAGVMVSIRPQDVAILVVFLVEFALDARARIAWRGWARGVALGAAPGALLAFSPQMMVWATLYGHPLQLPKIEEMHWFAPRLLETLFSDYHGLLSWSPVLALVPAGVAVLWRRDRVLAAGLAAAVVGQLYLNAANEIWWAGGSFGNRRFVNCMFPFVVTLGALLGAHRPGALRRMLILAASLAASWNLALFAAERGGRLSLDHYVAWDLGFVRSTLAMLLPWRALPALWGDFAGLGGGARVACAALALVAAGAIAAAAARLDAGQVEHLRRRTARLALLLAVVLWGGILPAWVAVAAWRTAAEPPRRYDATIPRRNLSLWNGYYEYGFYLWNKGRADEAIAAYRRAIDLIPGHAQPYRALATIHLTERDDPEAALSYAAQALDRLPAYPVALETFAAAAGRLVERAPWRLHELGEALAARLEAAGESEEAARLRATLGREPRLAAPR